MGRIDSETIPISFGTTHLRLSFKDPPPPPTPSLTNVNGSIMPADLTNVSQAHTGGNAGGKKESTENYDPHFLRSDILWPRSRHARFQGSVGTPRYLPTAAAPKLSPRPLSASSPPSSMVPAITGPSACACVYRVHDHMQFVNPAAATAAAAATSLCFPVNDACVRATSGAARDAASRRYCSEQCASAGRPRSLAAVHLNVEYYGPRLSSRHQGV